MKISNLINNIVAIAEDKFVDRHGNGKQTHHNDCIYVWLYPQESGAWEAGLWRPTQNQMDRGEVDLWETVKVCEINIGFYTVSHNVMSALKELLQKVEDAHRLDYCA